MTAVADRAEATASDEVEFVTFYVGDLLIGANILQVEEINRQVEVTNVPHVPKSVRGVINLRGDVVTVVDLKTILGLGQTEIGQNTRTVVVNSEGERVGLLVDQVADVVSARESEVDAPPANIRGADGRLFKGVHKLEDELLVVLDVGTALASEADA